MFDLDRWLEIGATLSRNPGRTLLTAAGVFWGMVMLLLMLGFGDGLERGVRRSMGDNAANAVWMWAQRTSKPYRGFKPGRRVEFRNADTEALEALPGVAAVAPRTQLGGWRDGTVLRAGENTGNFSVMGDRAALLKAQPMAIRAGRFINELDLDEQRKVAVLGSQVVAELFPRNPSPLGRTIEIMGVPFTVVGVVHSSASGDRSDRHNGTVHVPLSTFQHTFNSPDRVAWFALVGEPDVSASELEDIARAELARRHSIDPEDRPALGSWNTEREFGKIVSLFKGIRVFVWFVGVMTLMSGVVGVSNIMLIVVRERTAEIGLRRALGATRLGVVAMVLQESTVLTAIAGYSGLVTGVLLLELTALVLGEDHPVLGTPTLDLNVTLGAAAVLVAAGLFAGFLPARRAAAIHPVEALRGA